MRRIAAMLVCICLLCGAACAESLREKCGAPERFAGEYCTNTRKSIVTVNAEVFVPDADAAPVWEVSVRDMTAADAWQLAEVFAPRESWKRIDLGAREPDTLRNVPDDQMKRSEYADGSGCSESYHLQHAVGVADNGAAEVYDLVNCNGSKRYTVFGTMNSGAQLDYRYVAGYNKPYFYGNTGHIKWEDVDRDIPGQPTMAEARRLAAEAVAQFDSSFGLRSCGHTYGEITYHKAGSDSYRNTKYKTPAYFFTFTRNVAGIPVNLAALGVHIDLEAIMAPVPENEVLNVTIFDGRIVNLDLMHPYRIGDMVEAGDTLLPFDQVMEIFSRIAPLSIQSMENEHKVMGGAGNTLDIREIRLGYMATICRDRPSQWVLRPVWDFYGDRRFARENYSGPAYSWLTIDAIDGTVIDRDFGY